MGEQLSANERARQLELGAVPTDDEPEEISEADALAMILYMLFGPRAADEIEAGGYIRYFTGGTSPGILEQIDKRLVRIEETLGLEPMAFIVGDDEDGIVPGSGEAGKRDHLRIVRENEPDSSPE